MLADGSPEVVIELGSDGRTAAKALDRALRDAPKGSLFRPTLAGRIHFPEATFWREYGIMMTFPLAELRGSFQQRDDRSVLVGRIASWAAALMLSATYMVLSIAVALAAVAIGAFNGSPRGFAEGLGVAGFMILQLLLARRGARRSLRAHTDLLLRELHTLVAANVQTDS